MKHNKKFISLWAAFLVFFFCYMTMEISLMTLLSLWSVVLSIYILVKLKLPSKKKILLSFVLAFFVSIAYLGMQMEISVFIANGIMAGLPTLFCSLATFSVMEKNYDIKILSHDKKFSPFVSIGLVDALRFTIFGLGL